MFWFQSLASPDLTSSSSAMKLRSLFFVEEVYPLYLESHIEFKSRLDL